MTQRHILTRAQIARVALEGTFGTAGANPRRLYLRGGDMPLAAFTRDQLARDDNAIYQHAHQADLLGLQSGGAVKLPFDVKRLVDRLDAAATPPAVTDADALSHQVLLHHAFGTSHVGPGGAIHASTPATTTVLTLVSGQGANYVAGQLVFPQVAGVTYPRFVDDVDGDEVTVWPALPGIPAAAQLVLNAFCFARAEAHDSTISVETAHAQAAATETQRRARGVAGQIAWTAEVRKFAMWAFEGQLQAWDEGGTYMDADDMAEPDDMGEALLWDPKLYLFDATVGTNPAATSASKTMVALPNNWSTIVAGGGVEGAAAKVMAGARDAPPTFEVVTRYDRAYETAYEARTKYAAILHDAIGSGADQRHAAWGFRNLSFLAKPERVAEGGLVYSHLKFRAEPPAGSLTAGSTDFSRTPVVFALA